MTRFVVQTATVPGTDVSIRIVRNESVAIGRMGAYVVEIANRYGKNGSYGRSDIESARATANNHWSYVVKNRAAIEPMTVGTECTIKHVHGQSYTGTIVRKNGFAITMDNVTVVRANGERNVLTSTVSIPLNGIAK